MLEIAFEFRVAKARHPQIPDQTFWMMATTGKIDGIGHVVKGRPSETYPARRQQAMFFARSSKQIRDYFTSPAYAEAKERVEKPRLLVIPGRG